MDFFERLSEACGRKDSLLCVGLDPRPEEPGTPAALLELNRRIIGETAEYAACFKPNVAFYEAYGPGGMEALVKTLELIPEGTPVILDAKRNDIGSTGEAYARSIFGFYGADAVTIGTYMGRSAAEPFLAYHDRGLFALCRTSNPGAERIQDLSVAADATSDAEELYVRVARECTAWGPQVGLVVAANDPPALKRVRELFPEVWLLAPGIGAQGGTIEEALEAGLRADGMGILPVVVRSIARDPDPGARARSFRDAINRVRRRAAQVSVSRTVAKGSAGEPTSTVGGTRREPQTGAADPLRKELLKSLIDTGCFRLGEFVLKSGLTSPFYVDLRIASSIPSLLRRTARAYASLLRGVRCDRIAGVPVAALPFAAALSLETGIPLIYPRMTAKGHGTGRAVEGVYEVGERVVLVDDLITKGTAKIEAAAILQDEGLEVQDLLVLLERGASGRKEVEDHGIRLHAYAHISELLDLAAEIGLIDESARAELTRFASESS